VMYPAYDTLKNLLLTGHSDGITYLVSTSWCIQAMTHSKTLSSLGTVMVSLTLSQHRDVSRLWHTQRPSLHKAQWWYDLPCLNIVMYPGYDTLKDPFLTGHSDGITYLVWTSWCIQAMTHSKTLSSLGTVMV
jgi:hypothetical protein